jgi:hypothetical protein
MMMQKLQRFGGAMFTPVLLFSARRLPPLGMKRAQSNE